VGKRNIIHLKENSQELGKVIIQLDKIASCGSIRCALVAGTISDRRAIGMANRFWLFVDWVGRVQVLLGLFSTLVFGLFAWIVAAANDLGPAAVFFAVIGSAGVGAIVYLAFVRYWDRKKPIHPEIWRERDRLELYELVSRILELPVTGNLSQDPRLSLVRMLGDAIREGELKTIGFSIDDPRGALKVKILRSDLRDYALRKSDQRILKFIDERWVRAS
jgi:hypothetical protein